MKKRGGERRENDLFGQGASASISNVFTVNFGICYAFELNTILHINNSISRIGRRGLH